MLFVDSEVNKVFVDVAVVVVVSRGNVLQGFEDRQIKLPMCFSFHNKFLR